MPLTTENLLPSGMRERTFALVSPLTGSVKFGRATDLPASSYTFPSIEANSESYRRMGSHSTSFGNTSLTPDFFEAQVGAVEPGAADKLDNLARIWNMSNFSRSSGERHELYYVLGGRARLMYGKPGRIGFVHHGYKTSFHEALLRFTVSSPFFYDAEEKTLAGTVTAPLNTNKLVSETFVGHTPDVPSLARIRLSGRAKKITIIQAAQTMMVINGLNGTFELDNYPGYARTYGQQTGQPQNTGADLIGVETRPFGDFVINPYQGAILIKVEAEAAVAADVNYSIKWRNANASP